MTKQTPSDLSRLVGLAADGKLDRRDWQILELRVLRQLTLRETARRVGVSHVTVLKRLRRVTTFAAKTKAN
jgi:DNA-directed RNA polymerase specialized sigma subunit